jgi:hypothetical protein
VNTELARVLQQYPTTGKGEKNALLFLDQRTLKDRPGIKLRLLGPPETPSVFIFFLNWQVNQ